MKNLILLLLLIPMFCNAQSPDDHVVYPDTSLVIGTFGRGGDLDTNINGIQLIDIVDTGQRTNVIQVTDIAPFSYNIMESSYDTTLIVDFKTVLTDILNQNKPSMKKFEYKNYKCGTLADEDDITAILNNYAKEYWEAFSIDFEFGIIYFKREIQEQ